jgi:hypothetical protein
MWRVFQPDGCLPLAGCPLPTGQLNPMNQPTAVIIEVDEGGGLMAEIELVFASRYQAEMYVSLIPLLGMEQIKSAILSPLITLNSTG